MTRSRPRRAGRRRALGAVSACALVSLFAGALAGCREEVPLGSWLSEGGGAGTPGATGAQGGEGGEGGAANEGGGAGVVRAFPSCLEPGVPDAINLAGSEPGLTETTTDWNLSGPVESIEWDLVIERDVNETEPPSEGYYYHHRFSFDEGPPGIFGIQAEGIYQSDPPSSPVVITKIAVLWIAGPPLEAELGDIAYPDARIAPATANGLDWLTIHALFPWEVCHVYRFRIAKDGTDASANVWYGAWIDDTTTGQSTRIGRMLVRSDLGAISTRTLSRVSPIIYDARTCAVPSPTSALFAAPRGNGGAVTAISHSNRFESPARCATSRFTDFDEVAVRHQFGPL